MAFRELAKDLFFPEGPVAMDDGSVVLVEIGTGRIVRVSANGRVSTVACCGGGPNGAALGPDGALYVCNNGGLAFQQDEMGSRPHGVASAYKGGSIQRIDLETGKVECLYDQVDGRPLVGPNDLVFDKAGGFWFKDLGRVYPGRRSRDISAVYYAAADGSFIREMVFPMLTPNGIALSPDERTLYVADTEPARVWAFDVPVPGVIERRNELMSQGARLLASRGGSRLQ